MKSRRLGRRTSHAVHRALAGAGQSRERSATRRFASPICSRPSPTFAGRNCPPMRGRTASVSCRCWKAGSPTSKPIRGPIVMQAGSAVVHDDDPVRRLETDQRTRLRRLLTNPRRSNPAPASQRCNFTTSALILPRRRTLPPNTRTKSKNSCPPCRRTWNAGGAGESQVGPPIHQENTQTLLLLLLRPACLVLESAANRPVNLLFITADYRLYAKFDAAPELARRGHLLSWPSRYGDRNWFYRRSAV